MFIGGFFIPLILIALFYILLVYERLSKNKKLAFSVGKNLKNFNIKQLRNKGSIYSKREIKLVKIICLIVLIYIIAWTPYAAVTLASQFGSNIEAYINPYTTSMPALFAKTSSIYNPLIYTIYIKDFHRFFFQSCSMFRVRGKRYDVAK